MKRFWLGATVLGASVSLLLQGCVECEAIPSCISTMMFSIERDWAEGAHRIVADVDGEVVACEWELPGDAVVPCTVVAEGHRMGEYDATQGLLHIYRMASTVRLEIFEGEESVFARTFEPESFDLEDEDEDEVLGGVDCSASYDCGAQTIVVDASGARP